MTGSLTANASVGRVSSWQVRQLLGPARIRAGRAWVGEQPGQGFVGWRTGEATAQ
jgi:hypothetical protein